MTQELYKVREFIYALLLTSAYKYVLTLHCNITNFKLMLELTGAKVGDFSLTFSHALWLGGKDTGRARLIRLKFVAWKWCLTFTQTCLHSHHMGTFYAQLTFLQKTEYRQINVRRMRPANLKPYSRYNHVKIQSLVLIMSRKVIKHDRFIFFLLFFNKAARSIAADTN